MTSGSKDVQQLLEGAKVLATEEGSGQRGMTDT